MKHYKRNKVCGYQTANYDYNLNSYRNKAVNTTYSLDAK